MRKTTPKLGQVGRAYSEMSPLNPASTSNAAASSSSNTNNSQGHRGSITGYGSLFPFGFLRNSFSKPSSSLQVLIHIYIPTSKV